MEIMLQPTGRPKPPLHDIDGLKLTSHVTLATL